jgi:hypothetical protein
LCSDYDAILAANALYNSVFAGGPFDPEPIDPEPDIVQGPYYEPGSILHNLDLKALQQNRLRDSAAMRWVCRYVPQNPSQKLQVSITFL